MLIVGDGPVARALSAALEQAGEPVRRWWRAQGGEPPGAELAILAVRDEGVRDAAHRVLRQPGPPPVLLHCAGAIAAEEAFTGLEPRPAGAGLLHPLRAFAGAPSDANLQGTVFAVEGDDAGLAAARALALKLRGIPLQLSAAALPLYHAAAVLVSNHSVGLVDAGVQILAGLGLPRAQATSALAGLLASTARNLAEVGLPEALTGPISRGDTATVARHLQALPQALAALYRATALGVTKVAAEKGRAAPDALDEIRRALIGF